MGASPPGPRPMRRGHPISILDGTTLIVASTWRLTQIQSRRPHPMCNHPCTDTAIIRVCARGDRLTHSHAFWGDDSSAHWPLMCLLIVATKWVRMYSLLFYSYREIHTYISNTYFMCLIPQFLCLWTLGTACAWFRLKSYYPCILK